ncbi:hypothetical protein D6853_01195 [Butyrivibrio sp. X503]|uniref:hypothetical protein n=1 Tax=Butyrivibrio sp. X503 TaxID=2364878 RepID=UPI000EA9E8C6|nr:hypothetical protein [Butyrivibrio sp. X503]RKM58183.1 hypothetical protein D6853_01195 [Butyrivibrio sp. X503]
MNYDYRCDGIDGLVLIDEKYLDEIDDNLLAELDIILDRDGKTELIHDFPNEKWKDVRKRETKNIVEFCNSGKMVLFLANKDEYNCKITISDTKSDSYTYIDVESGKLIVINASELVQCLAYPELEMEILLKIDNVDRGIYSVKYDGIKNIELIKERVHFSDAHNVIEL